QQDFSAHRAASQETGHDQAVPTVVALTGNHDDTPAPDVRKLLEENLGRPRGGAFHEGIPRRRVTLDGELIQSTHLRRADQNRLSPSPGNWPPLSPTHR